MRRAHFLLLPLLACGGPGSWTGPEDCEPLRGAEADECWATHAPALFKQDPKKGVATVEQKVSDSHVRDYIWLTVTREVDPSSYQYCDRIVEKALADRCRVLVSRPHLHRELQAEQERAKAPQGAGGGPPPGGGGPPPPGGPAGGPPSPAGGP